MTPGDIAQRRAELAQVADRQFGEDAKKVMGMPEGQRLLSRVIYDELHRPLLSGDNSDVVARAARADFVKTLEKELQAAAPESFRQMHDERIKSENTEAATLRALTVPKSGDR